MSLRPPKSHADVQFVGFIKEKDEKIIKNRMKRDTHNDFPTLNSFNPKHTWHVLFWSNITVMLKNRGLG